MTGLSILQILIAFSCVLAIVYVAAYHHRETGLIRSLSKIAPMIMLIIVSLMAPLPLTIIAALAACTAGDWFLSLEGEGNFQAGLGAFLAGHLFYIAYFTGHIDPASVITRDAGLLAIILLALVAMVLLRLWQFLKEMKIPVAVYALVISLMAFTAKLSNPDSLVLAGIALFMISDITLANDKFTPLTNTPARKAMPFLVMITYYAGQILIVYGLLQAA